MECIIFDFFDKENTSAKWFKIKYIFNMSAPKTLRDSNSFKNPNKATLNVTVQCFIKMLIGFYSANKMHSI